jgi:hypothetical protein
MKSGTVFLGMLAAVAAFSVSAVNAADTDKKYGKEEFKSDAKAAGKGIKDAASDVGHQVATGTKKAYNSSKDKIKKDVKSGKPGDGSLAKSNDTLPAVKEGRKPN